MNLPSWRLLLYTTLLLCFICSPWFAFDPEDYISNGYENKFMFDGLNNITNLKFDGFNSVLDQNLNQTESPSFEPSQSPLESTNNPFISLSPSYIPSNIPSSTPSAPVSTSLSPSESASSAPSVLLCPPGSVVSTKNPTSCEKCAAGFYSAVSTSSSACSVCSPGSYASETGSITCSPCTDGKFSNQYGAVSNTSCQDCAAGTYSNTPFSCTPCKAGQFSLPGSSDCEFCDEGTYSAAMSATCSLCPAGFACGLEAMNPLACPRNAYAVAGSIACTPCPYGRLTQDLASPSVSFCFDPTINFVMGSISLISAIFLIFAYIALGSIHQVAFLRFHRVTQKCAVIFMKSYVSVVEATKSIESSAAQSLSISALEAADRDGDGDVGVTALAVVGRPPLLQNISLEMDKKLRVIIFMISGLGITFLLTGLILLHSLCAMFFQGTLVYKGIPTRAPKIISTFMKFWLDKATLYVPFIGPFRDPIIVVFDWLLAFKFNFDNVNVTCEGAQAPLELLVNIIILLIAAIFVETDYCLMLSPVISASYDKYIDSIPESKSFEQKITALKKMLVCQFYKLASVTTILTNLLRYLTTLATFEAFYAKDGWRHISSLACDGNKWAKNYDTFLAIVTSLLFHVRVSIYFQLSNLLSMLIL